jgi:hypothetical protein
MAKKAIAIKDFIILHVEKDDTARLFLPDNVDASKAGMGHYVVDQIGPDVKSVKIGDSLVTSAGLFKTEIEGKEIYFTKEELVCLIVREE